MREIPLSGKVGNGYVAYVSDEDYERLSKYRWYLRRSKNNRKLYAQTKVRHGNSWVTVQMHHLVLRPQKGMMIDHRDGNGLNNTRENLRECSSFENQRNRKSAIDSSSQYLGVLKLPDGRWKASIKPNRKQIGLGYYKTEEEAAIAYDVASVHYYGEYANPNFPERIEEYKQMEVFKPKEQSSKYVGVSWHKQRNKWKAHTKVNGRYQHIGLYIDEKECALARDQYVIEHGLDQPLNFPREEYA